MKKWQGTIDNLATKYGTRRVSDMRRLLTEDYKSIETLHLNTAFMNVSELTSGMCFGEVSLNHNLPRAATIRCSVDSHFAVMNKEDYHKCLLSLTRKKLQQGIEFLRCLPFLIG